MSNSNSKSASKDIRTPAQRLDFYRRYQAFLLQRKEIHGVLDDQEQADLCEANEYIANYGEASSEGNE